MKLKFLKIIAFILLYNISFSQPKDTIYGKVKSVREQLVFLDENRQNRKLLSIEGDYGHNGFLSEEYTKSRFYIWWYDTYWVHYINYYKEFDSNNKPLKVVWYYKDQSILNSYENEYDLKGNLIIQKKLNSYNQSIDTLQYDKTNNLILTKTINPDKNYSTNKYEYNNKNKIVKEEYYNSEYPKRVRKTEYYYDKFGNIAVLKKFDKYGEDYGTKFEYDFKNRKTKIIEHSPYIWVKTKTGASQKRIKNGNDQISREFIFDYKDRVIETKFYNRDFYNGNIAKMYRREKNIYENDLLISIYYFNHQDSLSNYIKYEYDTQKRKIKEIVISSNYPKHNRTLEYFYNETEYPYKLMYTEKNISVDVGFEYVFDNRKNWIEQTKSVNGEKLYVWKRKIEYYE